MIVFHDNLGFLFKPNLVLVLASIPFFLPFSVSALSAKMISPDFSQFSSLITVLIACGIFTRLASQLD